MPKRYFGLSPVVSFIFLGSILTILFLIALGVFYPSRDPIVVPVPPPLPTAINENFLKQVEDCFFPIAAVYGYHLRIASGFRTLEEQDKIYQQGRTTDGDIVTEAPSGRSIHNYGYAVDVADQFRGYNINWERLGKIGAYCGLTENPEGDRSHFEYRGGLTTDDFIAGLRPAPLSLPCPIMEVRARNHQKLTLQDLKDCHSPKF